MTETRLAEPVALVLERDVPIRMTRSGVRYYVEGAAEPLGHGTPAVGWRFRGVSATGDTHLFEVVAGGSARWNLRRVVD